MIFWKKTQQGRVVYNRRKHFFGPSAIARIIADTDAIATIYLGPDEFDTIISDLNEALNDLAPEADFTFSGGEFGGGGSTRPFAVDVTEELLAQEDIEEIEVEETLTFVPPKIENIIVIMKLLPWDAA